MPFNPTLPLTGSPIASAELRDQFNALHDELVAAKAALDWSNGAPKLPNYSTIVNPVNGNLAFNYVNQRVMVFATGEWLSIG